jgi:hypothetical protein
MYALNCIEFFYAKNIVAKQIPHPRIVKKIFMEYFIVSLAQRLGGTRPSSRLDPYRPSPHACACPTACCVCARWACMLPLGRQRVAPSYPRASSAMDIAEIGRYRSESMFVAKSGLFLPEILRAGACRMDVPGIRTRGQLFTSSCQ